MRSADSFWSLISASSSWASMAALEDSGKVGRLINKREMMKKRFTRGRSTGGR